MKRLALLLVPLCLAAGCAGSALRPDDAQQQEIQALKTRIVELQREAAMNQVELAQLRQQVAGLEARNGGAPRPAAPSLRPAPNPMSPRCSNVSISSRVIGSSAVRLGLRSRSIEPRMAVSGVLKACVKRDWLSWRSSMLRD